LRIPSTAQCPKPQAKHSQTQLKSFVHAPVSTYPGAEQQTHQGQTQAVGQKQRKVFYRDIDRNRALFKSGVNRESVRFCLTAGFVTARAGLLRRDLSE
jgi:hypothetical protein